MRQVVLFQIEVPSQGFAFQANEEYSFQIVDLQSVKWLYYQHQKFMTLNRFTVLFIDQHYAQWIDEEKHRAA